MMLHAAFDCEMSPSQKYCTVGRGWWCLKYCWMLCIVQSTALYWSLLIASVNMLRGHKECQPVIQATISHLQCTTMGARVLPCTFLTSVANLTNEAGCMGTPWSGQEVYWKWVSLWGLPVDFVNMWLGDKETKRITEHHGAGQVPHLWWHILSLSGQSVEIVHC